MHHPARTAPTAALAQTLREHRSGYACESEYGGFGTGAQWRAVITDEPRVVDVLPLLARLPQVHGQMPDDVRQDLVCGLVEAMAAGQATAAPLLARLGARTAPDGHPPVAIPGVPS